MKIETTTYVCDNCNVAEDNPNFIMTVVIYYKGVNHHRDICYNCLDQNRVLVSVLCSDGKHCTSTTASCAAEKGVNDHSSLCCDCARPLEEPTP